MGAREARPKPVRTLRVALAAGLLLLAATVAPAGAAEPRRRLEAVRQWVYRPTLLNGEPVEVIAPIDVHFKLGQ